MPVEERKLFVVLWVFCPCSEDPSDTCFLSPESPNAPKTDVSIVVSGIRGRFLRSGFQADEYIPLVGGAGIYLPPMSFFAAEIRV